MYFFFFFSRELSNHSCLFSPLQLAFSPGEHQVAAASVCHAEGSSAGLQCRGQRRASGAGSLLRWLGQDSADCGTGKDSPGPLLQDHGGRIVLWCSSCLFKGSIYLGIPVERSSTAFGNKLSGVFELLWWWALFSLSSSCLFWMNYLFLIPLPRLGKCHGKYRLVLKVQLLPYSEFSELVTA